MTSPPNILEFICNVSTKNLPNDALTSRNEPKRVGSRMTIPARCYECVIWQFLNAMPRTSPLPQC